MGPTTSRRPQSGADVGTEISVLFRCLADPTRLRILNLLAAGELCVCHLVEILDAPQPTVSRHLAVLREEGLVEVRRRGRYALYRLADPDDPVPASLIDCVRDEFCGRDELRRERDRAVTYLERAEACSREPGRAPGNGGESSGAEAGS